ncbi:MAG: tRNA 2-selenouridine(34) synthase MnmH, partial [Silicimonas sp.]|nr:tRNA 2-selenouridine(34) synthase MnmH [Silicimonas sp.]
GRLNVPEGVFRAMKAAPRFQIEAPVAARAAFLCRAYGDVIEDLPLLRARLDLLRPLQGHARVEGWIAQAEAGDFKGLAEGLIRDHYDPRYRKLRAKTDAVAQVFETGALDEPALEALADRIAGAVRSDAG